MKRILCVVLGVLWVMLAGAVLAADARECDQFRGMGAASPNLLPPYMIVVKLFDCADMTQDVAELDALDHDMLVMRAHSYSLKEFREKTTETNPPRKYSVLTSALRLARFKKLVDAYYKKP